MLVREGLQPLLRVTRYRGDEGEIRHTVRATHARDDQRLARLVTAVVVLVFWLSFSKLFPPKARPMHRPSFRVGLDGLSLWPRDY